MNKIIQILNLFRMYGFGAFGILISILLKQPVRVRVKGKAFVQNLDKSTVYHLLNSYSKMEQLVDALPAGLDGVAIDGGANNGLFSFVLRNRFPDVPLFAFEPSPVLLPYLKKNLPEGPVTHIRTEALSEKSGEITFFFSKDADQIGSLHKESVEAFEKNASSIAAHQVAAIDLDSFILAENIRKISILKLDVQGAELPILKGAEKALQITDILLVEVMLIEPASFDLIDFLRARFPYFKAVNSVSYGADLMFSKTPIG